MAIKIPIISEYDKRGQNDAETGLNKLGKSAKRLAKIGAAAFAAVGAGAVVMGKKLLDAGERAATSNARIEQITKSMGQFEGATDQVTDRLVKLAEKTAKLVGVDQNLIKEGQALLLTFKSVSADANKVGGVFDRATKAAIDLAAAGFGSVTTNAVQLGKALEDPIKGLAALGKSGVTFTAEQKELIKTLVETGRVAEAQEIILKAVETQVGGTAEATANASDRMKVAFSQLQESLGERLLPVFEKFATFFIDTLIPRMEKFTIKQRRTCLKRFAGCRILLGTQRYQRSKHLLNTWQQKSSLSCKTRLRSCNGYQNKSPKHLHQQSKTHLRARLTVSGQSCRQR
jgi:hypothetical protein